MISLLGGPIALQCFVHLADKKTPARLKWSSTRLTVTHMAVDINSIKFLYLQTAILRKKKTTFAKPSRTPSLSFAGSHVKHLPQNLSRRCKTFAESHVGTLAAFVLDNLYMDL